MVLDLECMLLDPASVVERCERDFERTMASRHDQIDRNFDKFEERKELMIAERIRTQCRNVSELEAVTAWEECMNDEDLAVEKLKTADFRKKIREIISDRSHAEAARGTKRPRSNKSTPTTDYSWDQTLRTALIEQALDISQVDTSSWTRARRDAYSRFREAPNTYLYYYRLPGEEQRHGPWDGEEHEEFLRLLDEAGGWEAAKMPEMQWGIFSAGMASRVGFQCSNHFLQLDGEKRRRRSATFHNQHPRHTSELLDEEQDAESVIESRELEWDRQGSGSDEPGEDTAEYIEDD